MIETKEQYEAQMNVIEVHLGTPGVDARETIEALREVVRRAEWNVGQRTCPICAMGEDQGHRDWCPYFPLPDWITE